MDVVERTHVVPLMYECDRAVEPPISLKADTVVLLVHDESTWPHPDYYPALRDRLTEAGIAVEDRECDMLDLYACLGALAGAIADHAADDVYVNLATGSKIATIAGMIACMTTGGRPYYVHPASYSPDGEIPPPEPMSHGVAEIEEIPDYPIDAPSVQHLQLVDFLDRDGPHSKTDLIAFCERTGMPFMAEYDGESPKGKYRLLENRLLDELHAGGFVTLETVGRTVQVDVTEKGRNSLRAYRHLLA